MAIEFVIEKKERKKEHFLWFQLKHHFLWTHLESERNIQVNSLNKQEEVQIKADTEVHINKIGWLEE